MDRKVDVEVACELCERCRHFDIETFGTKIIDAMGRGWPIYKPHCKHLEVCLNLLRMQKEAMKGEKEADG